MLFIYRSTDIIFSNYQKAWKLTDKAQRIWIPLYFIKVVITVITVKTLLGWQKSKRKFTAFWNRMAIRKLLQEQAHDDGRTSWLTVLVVGWSMRFPLTDLLLSLGKGGDGRFFGILFCLRKKNGYILWQKTIFYFQCKKSDWRNSFFQKLHNYISYLAL